MSNDNFIARIPYSLPYEGDIVCNMTWSQQYISDLIQSIYPDSYRLRLKFIAEVNRSLSIGALIDIISTFIETHENLVTYYPRSNENEYKQIIKSQGTVSCEMIFNVDKCDLEEVTQATLTKMLNHAFDDHIAPPTRIAVVCVGATPAKVIFVVSHMATDGYGCKLLKRELESAVNLGRFDPLSKLWTSKDQAIWERGNGARLHELRSLNIWRSELSSYPQAVLSPDPKNFDESKWLDGYIRIDSLAPSVHLLMKRHRVSVASIYVAAIASLLSWYADKKFLLFRNLYENRTTENARRSSALFIRPAPVFLSLQSRDFGDVVRHVQIKLIRSYFSLNASPERIKLIYDEIEELSGKDLFIPDIEINVIRDENSWTKEESGTSDPYEFVYSETARVDTNRLYFQINHPFQIYILADTKYIPRHNIKLLCRCVPQIIENLAMQEDIDVEEVILSVVSSNGLSKHRP